ncbi:MAG: DUF58 domain-containing protein [Treponema sp.]|nr:DUF58 domain-containing protein [Treponema sp.]
MKLLRFRPVLTPVGGAVIIIALLILIRSLVMRNSYEIVLSCGILLVLLALAVIGLWKSRKLKTLSALWKTPFPMTARAGEKTHVTGIDTPVPLFFRMHFIVRGRFFPCAGSRSCTMLAETSIPRDETSSYIALDFPMSGIFQGNGYCQLRDIFGFFSFSCGLPAANTLNVRSAPYFGKIIHINAQAGAEDKRNKPSADEERYYMREYTPGDRLRDINWKSSDRIDTLITRISTDNQEKITRIEVHFRNYCSADVSLEALWLLDRAKARLAYFLRSIKEQNSSFIFDIRTAQGSREIEDQNDLDAFLEELAGLSFSPSVNESVISAGAGDIYVFSTACDFTLPAFLLACNPRPVTLFISQNITANQHEPTRTNEDKEVLYLRDFISRGCSVSPRWFGSGKVKPLKVHAAKIENNYAQVKL